MKIAVLGYGTIGKSILKYIEGDSSDIEAKYVLRRPGHATEPYMTESFEEILLDPEVGTVVDVLSGSEDSFNYMLKALKSGKNVVSANKAAIALDMESLVTAAARHHVHFKYEASCGGTIPVVDIIIKTARTNYLSSVYGILNGTTNFIMDKMMREGGEFDDTLREAQGLGYAEADPTSDICGFDVKNKIIILASTAYHGFVTRDFPVMGIENVTKGILDSFKQMGRTIKLMGLSVRDGDDYALGVVPCVIDQDTIEAHVPLNYNVVTLNGDMCGDIKLYGQGAGGFPTADALLRDIYAISDSGRNEAETQFFKSLHYKPEMLSGTAYIGGERISGSLETLMGIARERGEFMAFDWPGLAPGTRPAVSNHMRTVRR